MKSDFHGRCALSFLIVVVCVGVVAGVYWPLNDRGPASIGAVMQTYPVKIVCAGPATTDRVFQFSSDPGSLQVTFDAEGKAVVSGVGKISLRTQGDFSDFEGEINLSGSRSQDGKHYLLEASPEGQHLILELDRDGDGKVVRTTKSDGKDNAVTFLAHCADEI